MLCSFLDCSATVLVTYAKEYLVSDLALVIVVVIIRAQKVFEDPTIHITIYG